jgi:RNA polymerase sigma factor (sigma-70 family)
MTPVAPPGSDGTADRELVRDFITFYKATFHQTFGTVYRAAGGDTEVAHDATQEAYVAMLKLWRNNQKPEGDVCRYVVGIAVHKVADFYRSTRRNVTWEEEHDFGSYDPGYAEVLGTMTILSVVRDFLDHQPLRRRAVGVLYFLEGFGYSEIAEALGMECTTARTHVQRCRDRH